VVSRGGIRRGEHEAPDAREPGRVEQAKRLRDIRLERAEGVGDGIRDPGTGGEVDDGIDAVDGARDRRSVGQGPLDEVVGNARQVGAATDRQVVEDSDAILSLDQEPGQG
jgi:hypothetical protein